MKKLNFLLLLLASVFTSQIYLGQGFTVSSCSDLGSNSYGPMNSTSTANSKNRTAFIIPASQLSAVAGGTFTSTFFKRVTASGALTSDTTFKIYLKNVTATDFGSSSPTWTTEIGSATLVYDSNPQTAVGNTAGWKEFTHTSNFVYTSGNNLAVYVEYVQATAQAASITWNYEYTAPCISTTNSNTTKYSNTTTTFGTTLGSSDYRRPLIGFNVILPPATVVPGCSTVSAPANAATGVSVSPTITWGAVANTHSYNINMGTTPGGTNVLNAYNAGLSTSYAIPSSLNYNTTYYVKVIPSNNIGSATGCTESTFTTLAIPCPSVSQPAAAAVGTSLKPSITWTAVAGVTGYKLSVGTTAGGTNVLNDVDLGNVLTYTFLTNLNPSTQYFYTVKSYQGTNVSTGCTERNFTTGTAVPPANDECADAITLTVNPALTCTTTTPGNTLGSTMSMAAAPCSGTPNDDVWYKFVATSTSHLVTLSNVVSTGTTTGITDMYFQVLSGACGTMTSVLCSDPDSNILTGLTPGQTYYVRVYTYTATATASASFNICVSTPPPPPANDDCANAVTVTVNPDTNCGSVTSGTTSGGTSSAVAVGTCTGTPDDDVWYKFIATATAHTFQLKNVVSVGSSSSTSLYAQVFSGVCGALTSTTCVTSNANYTLLNGLTVGQTYYVRVYNSEANSGASLYANTFDMCIGTLPAAPANDECSGAVSLTVNASLTCTAPVAGTTLSATNSNIAVSPCTGVADDDVWYSFTATGTAHTVLLSNVVASGTSTSTSLYTQVFSGACGTLTSIKCDTSTNVSLTGLTPGQVYYVRVYNSNTNGTTIYANNFNICIGTPPPPPANDTCTGAVSLVLGNDFASGAITSTNVSASTDGTTTCQTNRGDNVWYSIVVPPSGSVTVETRSVVGSPLTDTVLSVHSGSCGGTFTNVACDDDNGDGNFSKISLTGQTAGTTLYVSVWRYTNNASNLQGQFQVSAYDSSIVLATGETKAKDKLQAYPNPFTDVLNISDVSNVKSISVIDISGKLVKTFDKPESTLHLGGLNSGMYLVVLNMKDGSKQTIKAIKK